MPRLDETSALPPEVEAQIAAMVARFVDRVVAHVEWLRFVNDHPELDDLEEASEDG